MRREVVARKAALDELRNSSFTLVAGRLQGALGGRCGLPLCRYRIQLAACSWEPAPLRSLAGERGARGERVEGGSFTFGHEDPCWHFWLTRNQGLLGEKKAAIALTGGRLRAARGRARGGVV